MTSIRFSVIIPFFNSSGTLSRALDSVAAQTCPPSEIIIADDASSAAEAAALDQCVGRYGQLNIRVIRLPSNGGPGVARHAACQVASGSWLAFLDADDAWRSSKLEVQTRLIERYPGVAIWGGRSGRATTPPVESEATGFTFTSVRKMAFGNPYATSTVVVASTCYFGFSPDMRFCEDYDLWCRTVARTGVGGCIEEQLACSFKRTFGESGESAKLWRMEKGELSVLLRLWRGKSLGATTYFLATSYSLPRFIRRLVITMLATKGLFGSSVLARPARQGDKWFC